MNYLLIGLGILIYIGVIIDIIMTTLTVKGGGWLTSRISQGVWKLFLRITGRNGESTVLTHVGYLLLVLIVLVWVVMLNLSFILLLTSDMDSVINSTTKLPTDIWQKVYYSGYVLSTLGLGDYIPSNDLWRGTTILYSFTGLIFITMSITYFIPVLSAVIEKRKLGINLSGLGNNPQKMVLGFLDGDGSNFFDFVLFSLSGDLIEHSQNHRAYPVIHYFHNNHKDDTIILQIARLNEAVYILSEYIKDEIQPRTKQLGAMVSALNNYVKVVIEVSGSELKEYDFDEIDLSELRTRELVKGGTLNTAIDEMMRKRRSVLRALVEEDGWDWADVAS